MRRRVVGSVLELTVPVAMIGIWWVWSSTNDSFYFPPLPEILTTFRDAWVFERVGADVVPSVVRLGLGFSMAATLGVGGGLLFGLLPAARRAAAPVVEFLRAVPPVLLIPAGIVGLGTGDAMKVVIIALASVWPILLNVIDGVAGVEATLLETARAYNVRSRDRVRFVILPAALPQTFAGLRTSLSLAILVMVVSEMVAGSNGIGFFILQAQRSFEIPEMWSGILLLGLLGYTLNWGFTLVERRVLRWHRGARVSPLART